ncbi:RNA 3'-terminal phosphate cyclase [Massilia sp. S19_KUP03_FR1]|uniref:RNA 3'-terminal phosphate cyclase n=1 Tax=Massilia sp. S19_KUP03_FR1 TaxID=3025503 RepID=UPI002FCD9B54
MIEIDGSEGEGGGQVLRTALTLSMITGQPFRIVRIRARRIKPGLMRQHLAAVQAAAAISGAEVTGAQIGSTELLFQPQAIRGGDYTFAIGSAGSCTLVLQTILPALLFAPVASTVRISGGTHNPLAPPAPFLQRAYLPVLHQMGADVVLDVERVGFYPAGGGVLVARVAPCAGLAPVELCERGARSAGYAESVIAGVPLDVATRELEGVSSGLGWTGDDLRVVRLAPEYGPGNVLLATIVYEHVTAVFAGFGEKSVRAEAVAKALVGRVRRYIASGAVADEYLADQLMLPFALAGGGTFTVDKVSQHALTNASIIERFLPVRFAFTQHGARSTCAVTSACPVSSAQAAE